MNSPRLLRSLFSVLILLVSFSAGMAQQNAIRTDVLGPFLNNPFSLHFERNFDSANSLVLSVEGGYYMRDKTSLNGQPYWSKRIVGYGGMVEWRHYLQYRSMMSRPVGLFTGAYARVLQLTYTQDFETTFNNQGQLDITEERLGIGGGAVLGYKYQQPYSRWYVEGLVGLGYGALEFDQYSPDDLPDPYFLWRAEISIGYSFY